MALSQNVGAPLGGKRPFGFLSNTSFPKLSPPIKKAQLLGLGRPLIQLASQLLDLRRVARRLAATNVESAKFESQSKPGIKMVVIPEPCLKT